MSSATAFMSRRLTITVLIATLTVLVIGTIVDPVSAASSSSSGRDQLFSFAYLDRRGDQEEQQRLRQVCMTSVCRKNMDSMQDCMQRVSDKKLKPADCDAVRSGIELCITRCTFTEYVQRDELSDSDDVFETVLESEFAFVLFENIDGPAPADRLKALQLYSSLQRHLDTECGTGKNQSSASASASGLELGSGSGSATSRLCRFNGTRFFYYTYQGLPSSVAVREWWAQEKGTAASSFSSTWGREARTTLALVWGRRLFREWRHVAGEFAYLTPFMEDVDRVLTRSLYKEVQKADMATTKTATTTSSGEGSSDSTTVREDL